MKRNKNGSMLPMALVSGSCIFLFAGKVSASTMSLLDSGVQAYFGSQGSVYEATDPSNGFTWTPPGTGPYATGSPIPNLPAAPTPLVWPSPSGAPFGGAGHTSNFNDLYSFGPTTANSTVVAYYNPSPTFTSDANIAIPSWNLTQAAGAPSYAFEQLNFDADYQVNGGALLGSTPNLPLTVSGSVTSGLGNYAQFDAVITYTWASDNLMTGVLDPSVPLGQLTYSDLQSSGGPFSLTVNSSGSLATTASGDGLLEITGEMWVAGDPSSISISSPVPEPSSLALLAFGMLALGRRSRRHTLVV